ncbi:Vta1 like-domain-containing protein [Phlebopus sp. FC_14]|nr:Vta1 like-domain-containing protein [Phlebopus sp. FC_14]
MSLGLPPVSVGLKSITPYLQRAEELVDREPIIAYWCTCTTSPLSKQLTQCLGAYYAAQVGISLKAKDPGSRTLLFDLLGALERLKKEIGTNDAVDSEAASAAYVENFALMVFGMADDEDRAGRASKSTAKKFLAAGNFLEVLRVFPKADISDSTEEKIKYCKWKAADIAKAFREGRKPTPGPAGQHPAESAEPPSEASPTTSRSPRRQSPPPQMSPADIARANKDRLRTLGEGWHDDDALSPGQWSTTATPGLDLAANTPALEAANSSSTESVNNWHEHVVDPITRARSTGESKLRNAWVSTEMEGAASDEEAARDPALNGAAKKVRFSPTAESTRRSLSSSPPRVSSSPPRPSAPPLSDYPPGFVPTGPPVSPERYPRTPLPGTSAPPPGVPTFISPVSPLPPPCSPPVVPSIPSLAPPPPGPEPFELTPIIIAKAQKHCRFAISSLDYEDAQQARKELKAALELLGGAI